MTRYDTCTWITLLLFLIIYIVLVDIFNGRVFHKHPLITSYPILINTLCNNSVIYTTMYFSIIYAAKYDKTVIS